MQKARFLTLIKFYAGVVNVHVVAESIEVLLCHYCPISHGRRIFYRLSVRIRKKISSHRLRQMRMRCECWIVGEDTVFSYVIRMEPGWTSLQVFKCRRATRV